MKTCSKCGIKKAIDEYHKQKGSLSGVRPRCKVCCLEDARIYYKLNRDRKIEYQESYYKTHKKDVQVYKKLHYEANKEYIQEYKKAYLKKNRDQFRKIRQSNPLLRLNQNISRNIRNSLKGNKKGRHWETLVGYTLNKLKNHLEKLFTEGMSWENQGKWHIDHKIPVSAFNFTKSEHEDFKRCWALSNLQPLWATDNQKKYNKLEKPFQPMLAL